MTKIEVVDLEKLWNSVVDNFLIGNNLVKENYVWISKIWNCQTILEGEMTKTKVVDFKKL